MFRKFCTKEKKFWYVQSSKKAKAGSEKPIATLEPKLDTTPFLVKYFDKWRNIMNYVPTR